MKVIFDNKNYGVVAYKSKAEEIIEDYRDKLLEPEETMVLLAKAAGYTAISEEDLKPLRRHKCLVGISSTPLKIYYEKEELLQSGGLTFSYCPICGRNLV